MSSCGLQDIDILAPEITDFSIESTGKREIFWNDPDSTDENENLYLAQNDTGSTRLIFDIDRMINGHDMNHCDMVQVHYINIGSSTQKSPDIYDVTDLKPVDETLPMNEQKLRFSWTVGSNATKYAGTVQFAVHFICVDPEDTTKIIYNFVTNVNDDIQVLASLDNSSDSEKTSSELLLQWRDQLMFTPVWTQNLQNEDEDLSVLTIKREWDGVSVSSPESLRGPQGFQGEVGPQGEIGPAPEIEVGTVYSQDIAKDKPNVTVSYDTDAEGNKDLSKAILNFILPSSVQSVQTVEGSDEDCSNLYFFVGTKAAYEDAYKENKNVLAVFTDDTSEEEIQKSFDDINRVMYGEHDPDYEYTGIQQKVKDNAWEINDIKNKLHNEGGYKTSSKLFKYVWTDHFSEPVVSSITFPSVATLYDKARVYQYYDKNGNPITVDETETDSSLKNTIIVKSPDETTPSKYQDKWWSVSGKEFVTNKKLPGIYNHVSYSPAAGFSEIQSIKVTIGSETKDIPLDGTEVIFENSKIDETTYPNNYDGHGIRRIVAAKMGYGSTVNVSLYTQIKVANFCTEIDNAKTLMMENNNEVNTYDHDPLDLYPDAALVKEYTLCIGANALSASIMIQSGNAVNAPSIETDTYERFTIDATDFLEYIYSTNQTISCFDYILDADNKLFQIVETPEKGTSTLTLLKISREYDMTSYDEQIEDVSSELSTLQEFIKFNNTVTRNEIHEFNSEDVVKEYTGPGETLELFITAELLNPGIALPDGHRWVLDRVEDLKLSIGGLECTDYPYIYSIKDKNNYVIRITFTNLTSLPDKADYLSISYNTYFIPDFFA